MRISSLIAIGLVVAAGAGSALAQTATMRLPLNAPILFTGDTGASELQISVPSLEWRALSPLSIQVEVSGGQEPISIEVDGLPGGLTYDQGTRRIIGTPLTSGIAQITATADDVASGPVSDQGTLTINPALLVDVGPSFTGEVGEAMLIQPAISGMLGTPSWAVFPSLESLPPGLRIDPGTGVISGVPSATSHATGLRLHVEDGYDGTEAHTGFFAITVTADPIDIDLAAVGNWRKGSYRSVLVPFSGGYGTTSATFTGVPGVSYNASTSILSGTASVSGGAIGAQFTVSNEAGSVDFPFDMDIADPLVVGFGGDAITVVEGEHFEIPATLSGGKGTISWEAFDLPDGLEQDPETGAISGEIEVVGTYSGIRLMATDAWDGVSDESDLQTIYVVGAEAPAPTVVGTGTYVANTIAITPGLPSGVQDGDVLLLFLETSQQTPGAPTDWNVAYSNVAGASLAANRTTLHLYWRRYAPGVTAPTVADSGDHQSAVILAVRGAVATGTPIENPTVGGNASGGGQNYVESSQHNTDHANSLFVLGVSWAAAATGPINSWTQPVSNPWQDWTLRFENGHSQGNGGGIGIKTGISPIVVPNGPYPSSRVNFSLNTAAVTLGVNVRSQ